MKKIKKLISFLSVLIIVLFLVACGSQENNDTGKSDSGEDKQVELEEQTELNEQLKAEAKEFSFVEFNSDEVPIGEKVKLTGEITIITKEGMLGEFTLTAEETDGYGMYSITNVLGVDVKQSDIVTIYGVYEGKDEVGMPAISSTVIEIES